MQNYTVLLSKAFRVMKRNIYKIISKIQTFITKKHGVIQQSEVRAGLSTCIQCIQAQRHPALLCLQLLKSKPQQSMEWLTSDLLCGHLIVYVLFNRGSGWVSWHSMEHSFSQPPKMIGLLTPHIGWESTSEPGLQVGVS